MFWDGAGATTYVTPAVFVRLAAVHDRASVWKVWERGAPHVAVEVISSFDALMWGAWDMKLYLYQSCGVQEVVRFDPDAEPHLAVWDRMDDDLVERVVETGGVESLQLGAFWTAVHTEQGSRLRLARDAAGAEIYPSFDELRVRLREHLP